MAKYWVERLIFFGAWRLIFCGHRNQESSFSHSKTEAAIWERCAQPLETILPLKWIFSYLLQNIQHTPAAGHAGLAWLENTGKNIVEVQKIILIFREQNFIENQLKLHVLDVMHLCQTSSYDILAFL
jgi:hypothetical protein